MPSSNTRHFINELEPVSVTEKPLHQVLERLQTAIIAGVKLIRTQVSSERPDNSGNNHIYTGHAGLRHHRRVPGRQSHGHTGIALMFLRLAVQLKCANLDQDFKHEFTSAAPAIIGSCLVPLRAHHPRPGRLSPLDSTIGPALVLVLASLTYPSLTLSVHASDPSKANDRARVQDLPWSEAVTTLRRAVRLALADDSLGEDEVLYGRAGLLWGLLNLQAHLEADARANASGGEHARLDADRKHDLESILDGGTVEQLLNKIMKAGIAEAQIFKETYGDGGMPLMWSWHEKYYLGAYVQISSPTYVTVGLIHSNLSVEYMEQVSFSNACYPQRP